MDALTPTAPAQGAPAVAAQRRPPEQAEPPRPAPAPATAAEQLPALPAAVQRTQLDGPPPPKLMTREEMAALLDLMH